MPVKNMIGGGLILVDHISYGDIDEDQQALYKQILRRDASWERVFLINSRNPANAIDV
jgi:hypothetical protein